MGYWVSPRRSVGWGHWLLVAIIAIALALAVLPVQAQELDDGCDPIEPVACLPLPTDQPVDGPVEIAPGAAIPGVARPLPPAPVPCPPVLLPGGPPAVPDQPAGAARPVPIPDCSLRAVYAAINRANVVYVRAMRTLDPLHLSGAWAGEAALDIEQQILELRLTGRYADLALHSITPVESRVTGTVARVRTIERWTYRQRDTFTGAVVLIDEQTVENQYELVLRPLGWIIVRDIITRVDTPRPLLLPY